MAAYTSFAEYNPGTGRSWPTLADVNGVPLFGSVYRSDLSSNTLLVFETGYNTFTYVSGTGLAYNNGNMAWTSVSAVEHRASNGVTVIERINNFGPAFNTPGSPAV